MKKLLTEGNHYDFVPGPEHDQQWFIKINLLEYRDIIISYSDIKINGEDGTKTYNMNVIVNPKEVAIDEDFIEVTSSILDDIILKSVLEKTGRFVDTTSGKLIRY